MEFFSGREGGVVWKKLVGKGEGGGEKVRGEVDRMREKLSGGEVESEGGEVRCRRVKEE